MVTIDDDVPIGIEFLHASGDVAHGDVYGRLDRGSRALDGFADVEKDEVGVPIELLFQFLCGEFPVHKRN